MHVAGSSDLRDPRSLGPGLRDAGSQGQGVRKPQCLSSSLCTKAGGEGGVQRNKKMRKMKKTGAGSVNFKNYLFDVFTGECALRASGNVQIFCFRVMLSPVAISTTSPQTEKSDNKSLGSSQSKIGPKRTSGATFFVV